MAALWPHLLLLVATDTLLQAHYSCQWWGCLCWLHKHLLLLSMTWQVEELLLRATCWVAVTGNDGASAQPSSIMMVFLPVQDWAHQSGRQRADQLRVCLCSGWRPRRQAGVDTSSYTGWAAAGTPTLWKQHSGGLRTMTTLFWVCPESMRSAKL